MHPLVPAQRFNLRFGNQAIAGHQRVAGGRVRDNDRRRTTGGAIAFAIPALEASRLECHALSCLPARGARPDGCIARRTRKPTRATPTSPAAQQVP
jgi:hypothetical protein